MQITILLQNDDQEPLPIPLPDVPGNQTLRKVKEDIEPLIGVPADKQTLFFNNRVLSDDKFSVESVGIRDGDMVTVYQSKPQKKKTGQRSSNEAELVRLQALENPRVLAQLSNHRPDLAEAVNDPARFKELWDGLLRGQREAEAERERQNQILMDDPFNPEAQKKIEEMIRAERVQENLDEALENAPEAFGRVHMLYIPVEVNGIPIKAFVDSGAQATIMSPACAEKCNIMRLLDKRFAGMARGVGTAEILGRVHAAQIKIGQYFLSCAFTVMEGKDVELLLGLDMLKRYQACIDLKDGVLRIMNDSVAFLSEGDIPRSSLGDEPVIEGPGGVQVGGKSGALIPPSEEKAAGAEKEKTPDTTMRPAAAAAPPAQSMADKVQALVQMGFSEQEATEALRMTGGNVDMAASYLYGG